MSGPRLFVSAGDTSGDQHAARLLAALRRRLPDLQCEGLGGPELRAAGCRVHEDLVSHAIFGIGGALRALPEMFGVLRRTAGLFDRRRPDLVLIVDYPGLNLFVARLAARRGIPVVAFIAPQLWAWATWRARRFARVVDEALVIFPFEEPWFSGHGLPAAHIGHPLLDGLPEGEVRAPDIAREPRPVALLPGSRRREVAENLPMMLDAARIVLATHPDATIHAAHVSTEMQGRMAELARAAGVPLAIHGAQVHAVMSSCRCALVASGTATLETGLFGTPMVVVYRISRLERVLGDLLVVPPFVGQVNLVSGRRVCPEVITVPPAPREIAAQLLPLMSDTPDYAAQKAALAGLRARMAGRGAIERAAERLAGRWLAAPSARLSAAGSPPT